MAAFYRTLASYEVLIYILLAVGGLFVFRWMWNSWREWHQAAYKLEREFSLRRLSQATAVFILISALFCAEFLLASFVIPALPAEVFMSTPTLGLLITVPGTNSAETRVVSSGSGPTSLQSSSGCVPGQLSLASPEPGKEARGVIEIIGTVDIPNFGFYKYEVSPKGSDTWATISAGRTVVRNGILGRWDTTALTPGDYQLRVVVTDNRGEALPPCVIGVRVAAPP